jgi:hypothetical protein
MSQWNPNSNSNDVDKFTHFPANQSSGRPRLNSNLFDSPNSSNAERPPSIISNPFASEEDLNLDTHITEPNVPFATSPIANNHLPFGRGATSPGSQRGSVEFLTEQPTTPPVGYFHSSLPHRRRVHTWRDSMSSTSSNPTHHRTESNEKMIPTANSTFVNENRSTVYSEPFMRQDVGRNGYSQMNLQSSIEDAEQQEKPSGKARASYYSINNIASQGRRTTMPRLLWATFAFLCTFYVPDFVLLYIGRMKSTSKCKATFD